MNHHIGVYWEPNFESFVRDINEDYPGWSELLETIERFHDIFKINRNESDSDSSIYFSDESSDESSDE